MPHRAHHTGSSRNLGLLALVAALAVLFLAPSGAHAAPVATTWRGVNIHPLWATETTQQMDEDLEDAKQAGANVVRLDIAWATLDTNGPGQLTPWYSQRLDQVMALAGQLNLKVVAILFTTPCWASSAPASLTQGCQGDWWDRGVGWYPPSNPQNYASFVNYITSTYGSHLAAVEIWNEPNNPAYLTSANPAGDYAAMLKAAYPAAKAGDSSVPVLAASMAGNDLTFLQQLYNDGIKGYYDGISVHPYCYGDAPDVATGNIQYDFEGGLQALHALQLQNGDQTPIWVTEFGWDTVTTSPQDQASFIQQGYQILANMPYVKAGIVYELHDDVGSPDTSPGEGYGLMTNNYVPKPAYAAFTAAMTPPAAPGFDQPSGSVTNAPHATLSFSAAPSSTVAVYVDGSYAGSGTADASGTAAVNVGSLATGSHSVYAVDTDVYGNVGPASSTATFTVAAATPATAHQAASAATATAAAVGVHVTLEPKRMVKSRRVLPVTCSAGRTALVRCRVAVYVRGVKVGSGSARLRKSRKTTCTVRVRLTATGQRDARRAGTQLKLVGAATVGGGRTVTTVTAFRARR